MVVSKSKTYSNISINEFKNDLRIDPSDSTYDSEISRLIKVAILEAEKFTSTDIAQTISVLTDYNINTNSYRIWESNISINGISGITEGVTSNFTGYTTYEYNTYTLVEFNRTISADKFIINYNSGFANIPEDIKHAIKLKVGEYFDIDKNGYVATSIQKSKAFERLLSSYININF